VSNRITYLRILLYFYETCFKLDRILF